MGYSTKHKTAVHTQYQYNNKLNTENQGKVGRRRQQSQFSTRSAQSTGSNRSNTQQHKGALEVVTLAIMHFTLQGRGDAMVSKTSNSSGGVVAIAEV